MAAGVFFLAQEGLFRYTTLTMSILEKLAGTNVAEIIEGMESIYAEIDTKQSAWIHAGAPSCVDGCGFCCVNFEPDILESEALYLGAWLLENDPERAQQIADGTFVSPRADSENGCMLFNPVSHWHCTVYEGRCLICRLFGYSGDYGKNNERRYKPCRFLPQSELDKYGIEHKQYNEAELREHFNALPPTMSDSTEQALLLTPGSDGETKPLRDALPIAIRKIQWLIRLNSNPNDDDQPASA